MTYLVTFLEGVITFISPCLLPMLPAYLVYFAGGGDGRTVLRTLKNALGFVLGFTVVFVFLGAAASLVGSLLARYHLWVNIVTGVIVVIFGLNFMGVLNLGFLNATKRADAQVKVQGFFSSMLFGIVFSIGWTPCVGAFLGSALLLASQQGSVLTGIILLLLYSAGLGLPFILCALLIDRLKNAFDFIKRNYRIINIVCGALLVVVGILMATGLLTRIMSGLAS